MSLDPGTRLGHYEILSQIGEGGMGEVYRSHDPRLGRDVAIKVSAAQFTERFEREARAVAALNHPNICTLHDVGPNYLVMEYVEGVTLSDRIKEGPIPLDEALNIARQIADALEAAHEKGIVHRDLKPGNIKIKPDGSVKVLDFGLALVSQSETRSIENSPTISMAATQAGVILGTAAYMSPEQARGKAVDKRADIWAFGVVLHEMLTGERLFQGEDVTETLASVVKEQPNFQKIPPQVRRLLRKCLEKDPKKRLRDVGDAWELLNENDPASRPAPSSSWFGKTGWAMAAVLALTGGAVAFVHFREAAPTEHALRYTLAPPENAPIHSFAISPDGRRIVMSESVNGKRQLWLRALDSLQAQPMAFTEDAIYPFWSPDGNYIGFFAQSSLKKVGVGGGPSQTLCPALNGRGGSWSRDDVIVFSPNGFGNIALQRVSAGGGEPVDIGSSKGNYRHPLFLPDGRRFLYLITGGGPQKDGVYVSSLDGKENRRVLPDVSSVVFAASRPGATRGHLLFVRQGTLMAQPFNASSAENSGDIFPVADSVSLTQNGTYAPISVSDNGVLTYMTGGFGGINQIAWFDRGGKLLESVGAPGNVLFPSISPDKKFMAYSRLNGPAGDILVRDLTRKTDARFTSDASLNAAPFWSPMGDRILFASNRKGTFNLYQKATSGSGQDELLLERANTTMPTQWSRDGKFIVYFEVDPKNKRDIWVLPVADTSTSGKDERKPIPAVRTEFEEFHGQLSPDSHWIAYTSDLSGQREVYVRPFPPAEGQWKVSVSGGQAPRWKADGKEIFFVALDGKMMSVAVRPMPGPKPSFDRETPVALFDSRIVNDGTNVLYHYDVTADGKQFLINTVSTGGGASAAPLTVVVHWNSQQ